MADGDDDESAKIIARAVGLGAIYDPEQMNIIDDAFELGGAFSRTLEATAKASKKRAPS